MFAAEAAQIGVAEVVSEDDHDIGRTGISRDGDAGNRQGGDGQTESRIRKVSHQGRFLLGEGRVEKC